MSADERRKTTIAVHPRYGHDLALPEHDDERFPAREHIIARRPALAADAPPLAEQPEHETAERADHRHAYAPAQRRVGRRRTRHATSDATISATRFAAPGAPRRSRTSASSATIRDRSALSRLSNGET